MATDTSSTNAPDALPRWSAAFLTSLSTSGSELNSPNPSFHIPSLRCEISPDNYKIKSSTIFKTKKRAECIVEFYKHAGIIKNTREVWRCTSRRRALLALLNNAQGTGFFISFIKCIASCARSYRWGWLHALYLKSALVWRKVHALWKYNELFLTNHGAHISLNITYIYLMFSLYSLSRNHWFVKEDINI